MFKRLAASAVLTCGLVAGVAAPALAADPVRTVTIRDCVNAGGTAVITQTTTLCDGGDHNGAAIRY